ncbi:FliI/YscN family ATPase [Tropicimonas isoalkanivorans]|uniref:Flagellum-specific ATP synthase n=1 Tax=Tropicimonas isoalkanivorans TaxID=441112 RepID=A0A1I1PKD5_9RHOB|nr:FliI/YscN family ATPase [Tropicimonas isoalkanivorans]SFD10107.1 flagellum-specific ATP synthase [Tropicimonas isoalkanivorans]
MHGRSLDTLLHGIGTLKPVRSVGRIAQAARGTILVEGLEQEAALGDTIHLSARDGRLGGEVIDISDAGVRVLVDGSGDGVRIGDPVTLMGAPAIAPSDDWIGRVIDPYGQPMDGCGLAHGASERPLRAAAPNATQRRPFGARIGTGLAVFDTILPLVRGQRVGVFSGSGVGKSTLLGQLARGMETDVAVIALVGERGREVRDFVENTLGPEGLARSVVIAATSDKPPLTRRRALWTAMSVAEHFRDQGRHVLFLADSVTRFAEAHREVALASGETSSLRGYPPSVAHQIMALAERAGPGAAKGGGDITAIFTVLVAGSDMEEPIADILRGVLDGHIVLDRQIAERGRFPAVDVLRSVSRCLPGACNEQENALIRLARQRMGAYDKSEMMIQAGLYAAGSDPEVDAAIRAWPALDGFVSERSRSSPEDTFARLAECLGV